MDLLNEDLLALLESFHQLGVKPTIEIKKIFEKLGVQELDKIRKKR